MKSLFAGCSIRSTVRMTGVAKKTVMRLLVEAGSVAADYQYRVFRNLPCRRIQVDEMWAFAYNFIKIHRTLRLREVSDLIVLIEAEERRLESAA